jgi:hypothetical protein
MVFVNKIQLILLHVYGQRSVHRASHSSRLSLPYETEASQVRGIIPNSLVNSSYTNQVPILILTAFALCCLCSFLPWRYYESTSRHGIR